MLKNKIKNSKDNNKAHNKYLKYFLYFFIISIFLATVYYVFNWQNINRDFLNIFNKNDTSSIGYEANSNNINNKIVLPTVLYNPNLGSGYVLSYEQEKYIDSVIEKLKIASVQIRQIEVLDTSGDIYMHTNQNYKIIFNYNGDIYKLYETIISLYSNGFFQKSKSEYIDLRFGDRVYFK
jgi:hypothetical protein